MANGNFIVQNGLQVGPLTIDAATGSISTSGNVSITGNLGVSQISKNDSSIAINDTGSSSTVTITIDGVTETTIDSAGIKMPSGNDLFINGTSVLNATTLGSGVVNSSLTGVGTIATGTWNATTIATNKGGTGLTAFTNGGAVYATSTSALTTGTLPVASGGTGVTTSTGSGSVVLSNSPSLTTPAIGAASATSVSATGNLSGSQILSTVANGTAPLVVTSSTKVTNLNADLLDDQSGAYYLDWTNTTNKPDPVITVTLTGDVTGTGSTTLTDLANGSISIATTSSADSIVLGTDTTGNYVATIAGTTNQITATGSGTETAAVTLSLPQNIHTGATPTFAGATLTGTLNGTAINAATIGNTGATLTGTLQTASQTNVTGLGNVTTGTWSATAVGVAYGGTGATTASAARTNLGLAIGTDVQAYNATLAAVAGGTYTGDDSITTVGTIGTGTWNATTIATGKGGTGLTTFTSGGALYATSTSALTTGTLPVASGGTGTTTSTGSGSVVLSTSPSLTTPVIGAASGTSLSLSGALNATGAATLNSLGVNVDVVIGGNLTVNGTTTTMNTDTVTVEDKNITLANVATPTDVTADGGGITVLGSTNKTFNWVSANSAWTSSEDINVVTGKGYEINGASVLNATTLGSSVVNSSLTSVGTLTNLTVTNTITGSVSGNAGTATKLATARTISLTGDVTGSVSFDGSGNASIATTIAADSVVLGTDTTGNYVASIANGSYITGGAAGSEGAALTLAVDATTTNTASKVVARDANGSFAANVITATTFSGSGASLTSIPNGALTNSSVTVTAGTGLSGGGAVSLGGSVTLNNAGVTSITGTANQVTASASTGGVTLSLPQSIHTGATPTFSTLTLGVATGTAPLAVTSTTLVSNLNADLWDGNHFASYLNQAVLTSSSPSFAGITVPSIAKGGTSGTGDIGASGATFGTVWAKATSAQYADLAEYYAADAEYEPGTVVCFGGDAEVTQCTVDHCRKVAGVVSTNPAYIMNSELQGIRAAVALQGRVPCKVVGPVRKGDMMVAAGNGRARAESEPKTGAVIGKALENFDGAEGVIEVVIGRV